MNLRLLALASTLCALVCPAVANAPSARAGRGAGVSPQSAPRSNSSGRETQSIRQVHLVVEDKLLTLIGTEKLPADFRVTPRSAINPASVLAAVAAGDSLVWVGDGDGIPADLWVGTFRPADAPLVATVAESSPVRLDDFSFRPARSSSAFIKPPKEMPYHNVDEEPRADFQPLVEARDRFGQVVGYSAVLMHYFAPSSIKRRFGGSECFFFLFDDPGAALGAGEWARLLHRLHARFRSKLQIRRVETDYASYQIGERIRARVRVSNARTDAAAIEVRCHARAPDRKEHALVDAHRRAPEGGGLVSEATCDFLPRGAPGLWSLRIEVWQDPEAAEQLAVAGRPTLVDRREVGVVVLGGAVSAPRTISFDGPNILLEGRRGFWAGTNYYPSSSWWEWLWRDFRPEIVAKDFAAMRRAGYRVVRIWVDPVLDEQTLRAMDAAVYLAAQHGLVLDVCLFTQWVRAVGFERPDGSRASFDFRGPRDFNVYGISFRNTALQKEYARVLGERWRDAGNIIYNLSNETYVKDPDPTQMDPEVRAWAGIPARAGIPRDSLLFRRWAAELTNALRAAGAEQPIIPGYTFATLGGGDAYLANRDGEIAAWHSYDEPESAALMLSYHDAACSGRPLLLEEFGTTGWNNEKYYDGLAHYSLAAGAAGAMSYEWGVSWLAREMSFYPTPLRESVGLEPDSRWFKPALELAQKWSPRGVGLHPAPSGFFYGSIYHGAGVPAAAARALGRLGLMGEGLDRSVRPEQVYVLVPAALDNTRKDMRPVTDAIRRLWEEKIIFGVVQEDCLGTLPPEALVLVCPVEPAGGEAAERLKEIRQRGTVEVVREVRGGWPRSAKIAGASVEPGAGAKVLARRTSTGILYTVTGSAAGGGVTVTTARRNALKLGLTDYALIHEREDGISLVEASGDVFVNGEFNFGVGRGRAIVAKAAGGALRLTVTEPTPVRFARRISSVALYDGAAAAPIATIQHARGADDTTLNIDSEMARYVLLVDFAE